MSKFSLKPALGRVVLRPVLEEEMTEGGIYMPHGKEESGQVMEVVAVCDPYIAGPNDKDPSPSGPQFKIGDILIIGKYTGVDVQIGRTRYVIHRESDVLATFIPETEDAPTQTEHTLPSIPANGDTGVERGAGFVDPIATGLAGADD